MNKAVIKSIIVTFLFLLVISIGGAISSIAGINSKITLLIAYLILFVILVIWINRKKYWDYYGFSTGKIKDKRNIYIYIPLFLIALLSLIVGFSTDLKIGDIIYILFFMALVAFVEETIFRGIILKLLQKKSNLFAILGSSLLFSIPHILNALNGKEISQTILQISFALVIGIILAILIIKTNSIITVIIYHFINNTITSVTSSNVDASMSLYLNLAVFLIALIYMIYLYSLIIPKNSRSE
jgi:hypothetical protein